MNKKIISLILIVASAATVISGCGKVKDKNNNAVNGTFSDYLIAEKVGNIDVDRFTAAKGGLYYKGENGLYGVVSLNGMYDTGAVFGEVNESGNNFAVRSVAVSSDNDITLLNFAKLIDGRGRTIVPEGYMAFYALNERYILVAAAKERTYIKEDAVASRSENGTCVVGTFGDKAAFYKGTWHVYDTVNKRTVPEVSGNKYQIPMVYGRFIKYKNDAGNYITVDENGKQLSDVKKLFDDGSYSVESKTGEMYGETGELLFNYDLSGFIPTYLAYGKYVGTKYYDGASKYAVIDKSGKVISKEFDEQITVYGEILESGGKIYNLAGESIISGTYTNVKVDKMFGQYYMLINDGYYTLIDKTGAVFFNGPNDKKYAVFSDDMLASKKEDDGNYYYSYKDQDYTIKGYSFAPWIVKANNSNSLYDLVDTMTGKKLLEGYSNYSSIARKESSYYVYAKYNDGADIYLIESSSQLEDITKKKDNLYNDLAAAFEKEGVKATINKESGEIALDSSVLFGGDSSELTEEGKTFLNKFIRVYTDVVFSDKYSGFIPKTMIEGHTAPVPGSTYANGLQLSQDRAASVKNYCLSAESGIDTSKISDKFEEIGYSNSRPVYDANGNADYAACRRVSFRFIVDVEA